MEQSVYASQDIKEIFSSSTILHFLNDPAELRRAIEVLREVIDLLEENERQLYPDQAPRTGKTRRNHPQEDPATATVEQREARVLRLVEKLAKREERPPTLRELRQYSNSTTGASLEKFNQLVKDMVESGKLCEIKGDIATYYGTPDMRSMSKKHQEESKEEDTGPVPFVALRLGGSEIGIYDLTYAENAEGKTCYRINGDQLFLYESDDGQTIRNWLDRGNNSRYLL
jgi:hypothetical protein